MKKKPGHAVSHSGGITWKCPVAVNPLEAYALALLVRLVATREVQEHGKNKYLMYGERWMHSPTTLTAEHVVMIGDMWAYTCSIIRKKRFKTTDELDEWLSSDEYGPDAWIAKHPVQVSAAEKFLESLVGKYVCYG